MLGSLPHGISEALGEETLQSVHGIKGGKFTQPELSDNLFDASSFRQGNVEVIPCWGTVDRRTSSVRGGKLHESRSVLDSDTAEKVGPPGKVPAIVARKRASLAARKIQVAWFNSGVTRSNSRLDALQ